MRRKWVADGSYLVHDAYDESLLLDLVRLDGVLILQDLAYCVAWSARLCAILYRRAIFLSRTSVDQLLQLGLPSLLVGNLLLDSRDLDCGSVSL